MTPLQKIIEQQRKEAFIECMEFLYLMIRGFEPKDKSSSEYSQWVEWEFDLEFHISNCLKSKLSICQRQIIEAVLEEIEKNYIFAGNEKANEDNYCGGYNQALNDLQSKLKIE